MSFARALKIVLSHEGGYVDHPNDKGGATNQGITQQVYDNWRTGQRLLKRAVIALEPSEAEAIYKLQYWNPAWCDHLPEELGILHFDAAVNHGVKRAVKFLQLSVGASDDGVMGRNTMKSLETALAMTDEAAVVQAYLNERWDFYDEIVEKNPSQTVFLKGWRNRVAALKKELLG